MLQLVGGQDLLFKDKEVDPQDIAGLEELISRTEPLWAALSDAIAALEADLPKLHPTGPADVANPNRILSPGATQVCEFSYRACALLLLDCREKLEIPHS